MQLRIYSSDHSYVFFKANSTTEFNDIIDYGGAIIASTFSKISFEGFSAVLFKNNRADYGGAVYIEESSDLLFSSKATVKFTNNNVASSGAAVFSAANSTIRAIGNFTVLFDDHLARWCTNTCIPYSGQGDVVIEGDGVVWCSNHKGFICQSEKCYSWPAE